MFFIIIPPFVDDSYSISVRNGNTRHVRVLRLFFIGVITVHTFLRVLLNCFQASKFSRVVEDWVSLLSSPMFRCIF